jgi:hypothetical protein
LDAFVRKKYAEGKVFLEANECAANLGCPAAKSVEQNTLYVDTQSTGGDILCLLQKPNNIATFTLPALEPHSETS